MSAPSEDPNLGARAPNHAFFVLYVLAMMLVFLAPVPTMPALGLGRHDKAVHLGVFLGFALLYHLDRRPSAGRTLLVSFAFAGGIELVQWILPYRSGDWWDFTAGAAGAMVGTALAHLARHRPGRARDPAP